ncbi:MAG: glycosyltransferase [Candidatus Amulumruptor caecigallinarius]|nr:glycosyltransferase [Candidatus Amulumruptor caecigallinarius]
MKQTLNMENRYIFVIPDMGSGGAERVISILCNNFSRLGLRTEVWMLFGSRMHYQLPESVGVRTFGMLNMPMKQRIGRMRAALRDAKCGQGRVILYAFHDSALKYALAARCGLGGIRVISAERNNPYIKGGSLLSRIKNTLPYLMSSHSVFQTPDARKYYLLPESKCSVIPNPITPTGKAWQGSLSPEKLISVCRLHSQKNIPMLLEAVGMLRVKFPDIHLDIYGEGELKEELERIISGMGLARHVSLRGVTRDTAEKLAEASVFVSTSDYEGISNSMLEAMAAGMPVVCTDCPIGGARLMLGEGGGMLSPVGDAGAFARRLEELLGAPEQARRMAAKAKQTSLKYSPESISLQWLKAGRRK